MVVSTRFEKIFARPLAGFLASLAPFQFGQVWMDDQVVPGYFRLFPQESRSILANDLTRTGRCVGCRSPLRLDPGSRLGHALDDFSICRNTEGFGHLGYEHPFILSLDVAREMKKRFPRGVGLDPIVSVDSPIARRIAELFKRFQKIEADRAGSDPSKSSDDRRP